MWVAPFLAIGVACGALALAFSRWRCQGRGVAAATDDDAPRRRCAPIRARRHARRELRGEHSTSRDRDPASLAATRPRRPGRPRRRTRLRLRSIADLDAEHAAGDLDDADYATLKDDYTRRAAAVIRGIEQQRAAFAAVPGVRWRQVVVWLVGLALLGGISGPLIARSSGARGTAARSPAACGRVPITQLNQARDRCSVSRIVGPTPSTSTPKSSTQQPANTEAHHLPGVAAVPQRRTPDEAGAAWEEALRLRSPKPPRRPCSGSSPAETSADSTRRPTPSTAIDPPAAPPEIARLIHQRGLVGEVYGESRFERSSARPTRPPASTSSICPSTRRCAAAGYLVNSGRVGGPVAALKLYEAITDVEPDEPRSTQPPGADPGPGR